MKVQILKSLKENQGQYISGEELSSKLGVSRTAVWKTISILRAEGYAIESSSRRGYKLISSPDIISAEELQAQLTTKIFGKQILYSDTVTSTNTIAKAKAVENYPEGTVVIADRQTSGKGRRGRNWISPGGMGVWMSLILRPDILPTQAPFITIIAALAVARALEQETGIQPGIKWPNDIVYNKAKACGILTEMSAEIEQVDYIIVGIGINVNHVEEDFAKELEGMATSLRIVTQKKLMRKNIINSVLEQFEELYSNREITKEEILQEYKKYSVTLGSSVKVITHSDVLIGEAINLNEDGQLTIRTEEGRIHTIFSGEVSVRGLYGYV